MIIPIIQQNAFRHDYRIYRIKSDSILLFRKKASDTDLDYNLEVLEQRWPNKNLFCRKKAQKGLELVLNKTLRFLRILAA